MVIRRVRVWSVAKIAGATYAALGLLIGLMFAAFSMVGAGIASAAREGEGGGLPAGLGAPFGVGAIIIAPIFSGGCRAIFRATGGSPFQPFPGMGGGVRVQVGEKPPG